MLPLTYKPRIGMKFSSVAGLSLGHQACASPLRKQGGSSCAKLCGRGEEDDASRGSSPLSLPWQHGPRAGTVVFTAAGSGLMEGWR